MITNDNQLSAYVPAKEEQDKDEDKEIRTTENAVGWAEIADRAATGRNKIATIRTKVPAWATIKGTEESLRRANGERIELIKLWQTHWPVYCGRSSPLTESDG